MSGYWRLKQRLVGNRIEWYACHDGELGGETGDVWNTIDEAKAATQEAHDHICLWTLRQVERENSRSDGFGAVLGRRNTAEIDRAATLPLDLGERACRRSDPIFCCAARIETMLTESRTKYHNALVTEVVSAKVVDNSKDGNPDTFLLHVRAIDGSLPSDEIEGEINLALQLRQEEMAKLCERLPRLLDASTSRR